MFKYVKFNRDRKAEVDDYIAVSVYDSETDNITSASAVSLRRSVADYLQGLPLDVEVISIQECYDDASKCIIVWLETPQPKENHHVL